MQYSISALEKLSGIKAHTIRIWEQRYKVLVPNRTDTNIRYYDDEQLKKLLNVVTLLQNGYRISKISEMATEEVHEKVEQIIEQSDKEEGTKQAYINQLIAAALTMDIFSFEILFQKVRKSYNLEDSYIHILQPLLVRVGLLWAKSKMNPAQEHFLSNLIRQKLFAALDQLPLPKETNNRWLLFLPPDEYHDIGLLFAHFLLRKYNNHVLYLGANVPLEDIKLVAESYKPTHALLFVIKNMSVKNGNYVLENLQKDLPDTKLLISGNKSHISKFQMGERYTYVSDPKTFMTNNLGL
jgi:MerR family transcriptional regulator, light-induced transcriptional regulator